MSTQNLQSDTVEITLPGILFSVVKNRKSIWICMLIFALLLGCGRLAVGIFSLNNQETYEQAQADSTLAKDIYDSAKEKLQNRMSELQTEIERQGQLKESAELLRIDPYHTYTERLTYYIDTGYEVSPELSFQTPDYVESLVKAYSDIVLKEDFNALLTECLGQEVFSLNPVAAGEKIPVQISGKQLVTIEKKQNSVNSQTTELSEGILTIVLVGESEEVVKHLSGAIAADIAAATTDLQQAIGEHTITLISDSIQMGADQDLIAIRQTFDANLQLMIESLYDTVEDFEKLKEPDAGLSVGSVALGTVLFAVIGAILGLVFSAIWLVVKAVTQDKLTDAREISRRYGLQVLGAVPAGESKTHWLERRMCEGMGIPCDLSRKETIELAGAKIDLYLDKESPVWLTGSVNEEKLAQMAEELKSAVGDHSIQLLGNVSKSAEAIQKLKEEGAVICVEELFASSHQALRQELSILEKAEKEVSGFILLR